MSVQFEEQYTPSVNYELEEGKAGLGGILVRMGVTKTQRQALGVLLFFGAVLFMTSAFIFVKYVAPMRYEPTPEEKAATDKRISEIESRYLTPRTNIR